MKIVLYIAVWIPLLACTRSQGARDVETLDLMVEEIEKKSIPLDTLILFYLEDLNPAKRISDVVNNDKGSIIVNSGKVLTNREGRGRIYAYKTEKKLLVFAVFDDSSEQEHTGFAYSSVPNEMSWDKEDLGKDWRIMAQYSKHRWQVRFMVE